MLAEYKRKTNIGVGLGIVAQFIGRALMIAGDVYIIIGLLILVVGIVIFIWGCSCYAKGKGQHAAWGLLGFLSLLGLIILVFLTDKCKAPTQVKT